MCTTEVFGSNGSVGDGRFVRYPQKSLTLGLLIQTLNLRISKMSAIPENPACPNPALPKTPVLRIKELFRRNFQKSKQYKNSSANPSIGKRFELCTSKGHLEMYLFRL